MKTLKVVAFNGSPRKDGNTSLMIRRVFDVLEQSGIATELVQVGGNLLHGCKACYLCFKNKDGCCVQVGDPMNEWIAKMREADGIILGSPTYFADVSPELKALIDRAGLVAGANDNFLRRKVGAAVIAVRRGGAVHVFDSINHFFLIRQMVVPGSCYWNFAVGREKGESEKDEEGLRTMQVLGENMAWLLRAVSQAA
jgi:multimeric flavodoxin WrbA